MYDNPFFKNKIVGDSSWIEYINTLTDTQTI